MILYIIRHAESENNALWRRNRSYEGRHPDPDLTKTGYEQAKILANHLAQNNPGLKSDGRDPFNYQGFGVTHLYTSLMRRAIATAGPIAKSLGLPLVAWPDIHERRGMVHIDTDNDLAIGLPGPNRAFFEENYPDLILPDSLGETGWWDKPAETLDEAVIRGRQVMSDLMTRHGRSEDRVAIITHGAFYQNIMGAIIEFGLPDGIGYEPSDLWFSFNNVALTRVDFEPERTRVVYANRVDFLPEGLVT